MKTLPINAGDFQDLYGNWAQVLKIGQSKYLSKAARRFSYIVQRVKNPKTESEKFWYAGCSIDPHFEDFQFFAEWCWGQIGYNSVDELGNSFHIDKDILVPDNKVYGPETCAFIPAKLNSLFKFRRRDINGLPTGVSFYKRSSKFLAQGFGLNGENVYLGYYDDIESAAHAYADHKVLIVRKSAKLYKDMIDPKVYVALKDWSQSHD
jgi:hypothetical protein